MVTQFCIWAIHSHHGFNYRYATIQAIFGAFMKGCLDPLGSGTPAQANSTRQRALPHAVIRNGLKEAIKSPGFLTVF
jgi:hypothetical protein